MKVGHAARALLLCCIVLFFGVTISGRTAFAQTNAAKALAEINADLKIKSKTLSPYAYLDEAEKAMLGFLKRYPQSPEAAEAHFTLGRIYSNTGAHEQAIRHFRDYLASPGEKGGPSAVAQAKYVMGTSYVALERFDDAEKMFREITKAGSAVDSRVTQGAAQELERLPALRKLRIGGPALEIAGTSHQGKKISLKAYRGKVVLVDFWAAWCSPCRQEMPNVIKTYGELNKKGFEIIGISLDNDRAQFENFLRDNKMPWPQLFDGKGWQSAVGRSYAVSSIPATFLIDKKGIIRFKNLRGEKLREAVKQLLAES